MGNKFIQNIIDIIRGKRIYKEIKTPTYHYGKNFIYGMNDGNNIILNALKKEKPCFIGRFGRTELRIVEHFYQNINKPCVYYPSKLKNLIKNLSGFFSPSDELLNRFSCEMLNATQNIDVIAVWNYQMPVEKELLDKYSPNAQLVKLDALGDNIFRFETPWTYYLKDKKVLIIHPFEKTVRSQYERRELIFKNPKTLPSFELKTIKAIQGLGEARETENFVNWFDALESMYRKIDNTDFDIALIGAGAYGFLLGNYVKSIGKQAVHVGGALQLLFGIKGERWLKEYGKDFLNSYLNEYWVYPDKDDYLQNTSDFVKGEGSIAYW